MSDPLEGLAEAHRGGAARGVVSVCSAHPLVVGAALRKPGGGAVVIEATCNQVNQEGGYTGLTPVEFRDAVQAIAARTGFARERLILGGDHLGPNPWRHLPAGQAMARAQIMVADYVAAGFTKIHLDCSMGCAGEPTALPDDVTAARAARLAVAAQAAADRAGTLLHYVIGTEVPTPGGALEELSELEITRPEAVRTTYDVHRAAFAAAGAEAAFNRVIALVVQPGVEFGHTNVVTYRPERAQVLSATLDGLPVVFEAHSTDYQPAAALAALVRDGFAVLKVGPALTFALREALYGLDHIASALDPAWRQHSLAGVIERAMLAQPEHWRSHYHGAPEQQRVLRHYSFSDRIRYYWPVPEVQQAVAALLRRLDRPIPLTLVSQYLPRAYDRVAAGALDPTPEALVRAAVQDVLAHYAAATQA